MEEIKRLKKYGSLILAIFLVFSLVGCSSGNNNQDGVKEVGNSEEYTNTAVETELFAGTFIVGEDVVAGRYDVTTEGGTGNFVVYEGQMPVVNEVLTNDTDNTLGIGVTKIQIDLKDEQSIEIAGLNAVILKPSVIELKTTLGAGNYLVGRDVPEGTYIATAPKGIGNFVVYKGQMPAVNEVLGKDDMGTNIGVEKVRISVKKGQMIVIGGLEIVELTPQ